MRSLFRIGLVVCLCGLALSYLLLHNWSLALTRRLDRLEKQRCLFVENRDSLETEIALLTGFTRLESLWVDAGRPQFPPGSAQTQALRNGVPLAVAGGD